ncbi:uncharacterized protein LOC117906163 [Vitis riparia]|uniref:uncharacterized protein LOC117906163 n=1 Tax=Vitis riparia TaxID=96939 RepID=UPI00155B1628|nr:uncharacterized protein LOC117906163 [Vitis riparia]
MLHASASTEALVDLSRSKRISGKVKSNSSFGSLMESSSSSSFQSLDSSEYVISNLDHFNLFILRPFLATTFVLSFILLGWLLAWKLVLVHVPLVQEIFGLRNKSRKPKPQTGRLSRFYSNINARDPASG